MYSRITVYPGAVIFVISLYLTFVSLTSLAQSPEREKPRLKDFGTSLKQLRWNPEKNAAVEIKQTEKSEMAEDVVRVETSLVVCDVQVLDRQGRTVQGLTKDDFTVTEDGQPQQIDTFSLGDNAAVQRSIVLIIDYSGSQYPYLKTSIEAAKTLVDKLDARDRMAIVTDDVELIQDFTRDKVQLKSKLESLQQKVISGVNSLKQPGGRLQFGRSAQYSALLATLNEIFDDEDLRPIIIFQTDGDELGALQNSNVTPYDTSDLFPGRREVAEKRYAEWRKTNLRQFSLDDVYKAAEKSRATIYTVVSGYRFMGLSLDKQLNLLKTIYEKRVLEHINARQNSESQKKKAEDFYKLVMDSYNKIPPEQHKYMIDYVVKLQAALAGAAEITGGWTEFLEEPSQADGIYSRIFSDISQRYILAYYPTNENHDGKRRKVKIEVRGHPDFQIFGRKSYFAPEPENQ